MKKIGFKESRISKDNYYLWRRTRSSPAVQRINAIMPLNKKRVLEIGCGFGALSELLAIKGAKVNAVEIDEAKIQFARKMLKPYKDVDILKVKDEKLPFEHQRFDAIFIFDVIEHVRLPAITVSECSRLLRKGGILYVEFTPYYSITGHHLYDFAKWPIHILPKHMIRKIVYSKKIPGFLTQDDFWNQFESLNKLRICEFRKMLTGFAPIDEKYIIKYPEVFELNAWPIKYLGKFADYMTMSFEGIYRKI